MILSIIYTFEIGIRQVRKRDFAFDKLCHFQLLEQELAQLRRELGALRSEIQTLRDVQRREPDDAQAAPPAVPWPSLFLGERRVG